MPCRNEYSYRWRLWRTDVLRVAGSSHLVHPVRGPERLQGGVLATVPVF